MIRLARSSEPAGASGAARVRQAATASSPIAMTWSAVVADVIPVLAASCTASAFQAGCRSARMRCRSAASAWAARAVSASKHVPTRLGATAARVQTEVGQAGPELVHDSRWVEVVEVGPGDPAGYVGRGVQRLGAGQQLHRAHGLRRGRDPFGVQGLDQRQDLRAHRSGARQSAAV